MAGHKQVGKADRQGKPGLRTGASAAAGPRHAPAARHAASSRQADTARTAPAADRATLLSALDEGLTDLELPLAQSIRERLIDYLSLLSRWNAVYNLTAVRDPGAMLVQHLLDSLAIVPPLAARGPFRCLVDVGSGGGLPGIVLAIVWPQTVVHLVEPVGKKAAFLRQCGSELSLAQLRVHATRVELLAERREIEADLIVCRAFASLRDYVSGVDGLVGPTTIVAAMKGRLPTDEISALPQPWRVQQTLPLVVPRLDAERHLLILERAGDRSSPPTH